MSSAPGTPTLDQLPVTLSCHSRQLWGTAGSGSEAVIRSTRTIDANAPFRTSTAGRPLGRMSDKDSSAAASRGDTMI